MTRKAKIITGVLVAVVIAGILYFFVLKPKAAPLVVETATVKTGDINTIVTATGTIEAVKQVEVGTQVSGVVEKVYVDYNSVVKAGQLIAELDKENLQQQLTQARSAYNVALNERNYLQMIYDRQKSLYNEKVISRSEFQEAEYNLATGKGSLQQKLSDLKKAETNLGYSKIYSPIDGVVLSKDVNEGQTVAASFSTPTLFTIAQDLKQMQVEADVDEADIGNVKQGQRVVFTVDAFPGEEFNGAVTQVRLNSTVESNVVTYKVIIKADNPDEKLKPGLTATVSIYTMEIKDVLILEAKALNFTPDPDLLQQYNAGAGMKAIPADVKKAAPENALKTVWIKSAKGMESREVKTGRTDGINYEILSGLSKGDEVVTTLEAAGAADGMPQGGASSPFMPKPPSKK
ncbi:efflux RND transporter periplasmic adaptor subunit [Flavobacterium sp. DGU11]|uniref:Efflux RND transporter periplasmic adaptor subunit n=1 Tax=Flavobacterium arundinis TaxID=3139143 RepID=A0ABU9HRP1_9FLAO